MINISCVSNEQMKFEAKWLFVLITVTSTTIKAFNIGYHTPLYLVGAGCNCYFFYTNKDRAQKLLNAFYVGISLVGAYSYS